jgi:hypothetical protein
VHLELLAELTPRSRPGSRPRRRRGEWARNRRRWATADHSRSSRALRGSTSSVGETAAVQFSRQGRSCVKQSRVDFCR